MRQLVLLAVLISLLMPAGRLLGADVRGQATQDQAVEVPAPTAVQMMPDQGMEVPALPGIPLTLHDAIALALRNNPQLCGVSGANVSAQARIDAAKAAEGIQVHLASTYSYTTAIPTFQLEPGAPAVPLEPASTLLSTLSAQQVVYSGGRLQALVREATDQATATAANGARTRQTVIYQTERTFELLVAAQQEHVVAVQTLTTAQAHLHDAQVRYQAGAAARYDVLRAQLDVDSASRQESTADADIKIARDALVQAIGLPQGDYTAVEVEPPILNIAPVETFIQEAYAHRPELRALNMQICAEAEAIKAACAQRLPTVTLNASYSSVVPESIVQVSGWTVGVGLLLPIWDSGLIHAQVCEAQGQYTQAVAAYNEMGVEIGAEVRDAYARYEEAAANIGVAREQVEVAQEAYRIAEVRFRAGVGTATENADAQSALLSARQALVQAQANLGIALSELEYAAGNQGTLLPGLLPLPASETVGCPTLLIPGLPAMALNYLPSPGVPAVPSNAVMKP